MLNSVTSDRVKKSIKRLLLPRPGSRPSQSFEDHPVVVAGMFQTANGLGHAAVGCVEALRMHGVDVIPVDTSEILNQVESAVQVQLARMPRARQGTLILFANPPETESVLYALGLRRWHNWRIIANWVWELQEAPHSWRSVSRLVDEVWTPSAFSASVIRRVSHAPVRVLPHFVRPPEHMEAGSVARERNEEIMNCLVMADGRSSFHRKNVRAAIRLFGAAFQDERDARLTLKCRNLEHYPEFHSELRELEHRDERIRLITHTMSSDDKWQLLHDSDVLLSPHRSEGFGLQLAEAMALGRCVVATGWSGNMQFMSSSNSSLLPFKFQPVTDPFQVYAPEVGRGHWAEPDFDAGVETLRHLFRDPGYRHALGEQARVDIRRNLDGRAYIEVLDLPDRSAGARVEACTTA